MSAFLSKKQKSLFNYILLLLLTLPATSYAASYSKIIAFGDSLSDHGGLQKYLGLYDPVSNPNGVFTTWSDGDVWIDYLKTKTNSILEDRAIAGAMTEGHEDARVQSMIDSGVLPDLGLTGQVATFTASSPVIDSAGTLFTIWIGGNDLLEYSRGESKYSTPDELLYGTTGAIIQSMESLYSKGAKNFLVLNLPDIGKSPAFSSSTQEKKGLATLMSLMYNQALWNKLDQFASSHPDATLKKYDAFSYINTVLESGAFPSTTSTYMKYDANGNRTLEHNEPASDYFFWDMIHPMTKAHHMLADSVFSGIGASVNHFNPVVAFKSLTLSAPQLPIQTTDQVTVTVDASATNSATLYYEFYYCANYGTADYASTPWTKVKEYSTANTCSYSFPSPGNYVVVARAVTDPSNIPSALPLTGTTVSVGGSQSQVNITKFESTATPGLTTGTPVGVAVNASTADGSPVSYKFFYCGNYGSSTYDTTAWKTVQEYSANNSCAYTFADPGHYVVVARAVTDPANEPSALPIIGGLMTVNAPAQ